MGLFKKVIKAAKKVVGGSLGVVTGGLLGGLKAPEAPGGAASAALGAPAAAPQDVAERAAFDAQRASAGAILGSDNFASPLDAEEEDKKKRNSASQALLG